jgi:hypothetical protein
MLRCSITPVSSSIRSASVDLPWSMWAMMQKFRIRAGSVAGLVTQIRSVVGSVTSIVPRRPAEPGGSRLSRLHPGW